VEPDISKDSVLRMLRRLAQRDFHRLAKTQLQLIKMGKKKSTQKGGKSDALTSKNPTRGRGVPASMGSDHLLGVSQSIVRDLAFFGSYTANPTAAGGYVEGSAILNSAYQAISSTSLDGFSKYMAFYSKCFTVGARVRVTWTALDANTYPVVVGITTSTLSTSLGSASAAVQNGICKWDQLFLNPNSKTFSTSLDVANFLHKPRVLDDSQLYATASAQPVQLLVAHFWAQNNAPTGTQALTYSVEIVQKCIFTDPIPFT
jgi:hypothetical protein